MQLARYFTNEVFQIFESENQRPVDPLHFNRPSSQVAQAWKMLKALRTQIDSISVSKPAPSTENSSPPTTPVLDISELEAWSSLIIGSDDTLALPAYEKPR